MANSGASEPVLAWLHIGDLHLTEAKGQNHRDLMHIIELVNALPPRSLDFVLLPGDNADHGAPEQQRLVHQAVMRLCLPLHILPGDHDFAPGNLDAFYTELRVPRLPYAISIKQCRCLFLDVVSAGTGGPDFRLDPNQLAWIEHQLNEATRSGERPLVFMHTYPADLREGAKPLRHLLAHAAVLAVDMGHTHYNELANDGATIFMATRSTGQVEEGPPGFSIAAIDGRAVSWRFNPLSRAWPFVLITHPPDHRLLTRHTPPENLLGPNRNGRKW